jgi:hypothetical protein
MRNRKHRIALSLALCAVTAAAQAQQLYRCGNTYSQTPCAIDAKPTRLHQGTAPDKAPGVGFELCEAAARAAVATPEPASARVVPLGQRVSEVIQYAGQPLSVHRLDLTIDAKTEYGMFSGAIAYSCWLSEDQARVLQFGPRRLSARK